MNLPPSIIDQYEMGGFSLIASYSFNEMKFTGGNGKNSKTGDRLRYNPSLTANAHVFYTFDGSSDL